MKLDNAAIAERLEAFASLLDLAGAGPYTARAYRRAAEMIRSTPASIEELVREGRVRELRGIGPGIERRLGELVQTGEIAELQELEREVSPELAGVARFLGVSVRRMLEIGRVLGVRNLAALREAAEAGRLTEVPGIGPETERKLRTALSREPARSAPQPLLLSTSRPLVESVADALGGAAAGDPRRWADASEHLAVVCSSSRPGPVLDRFGSLPQIVAVVERGRRRALGVTVEGVPVELVVAEPERFGTELVRATGSAGYVEALEPLPEAPTEEDVYEALGVPFRDRGARQEEQVELMRQLWTEEVVTFRGRFDTVSAAGINPRPTQAVPVWLGGTAPVALARCGRIGDGYIAMGEPDDTNREYLEIIRSARAERGLSMEGFGVQAQAQFVGGNPEGWRMQAIGWRDLGATHLAIATHNAGPTNVDGHLGRLRQVLDAVSYVSELA